MTVEHPSAPDTHQDVYTKTLFGFWVYLMTDCILFSTLFATYAVLHNNTFGGPSGKDLFSISFVLKETIVLLASTVTCGMAMLNAEASAKKRVLWWFAVTFILGASFVGMEIHEFIDFVREGHGPTHSGFLSAFFTLVGTHGAHVSIGLLWMIVLLVPVYRKGLTEVSFKRLTCLKLFWHFLDVVWIFLFTFVYLMGAI